MIQKNFFLLKFAIKGKLLNRNERLQARISELGVNSVRHDQGKIPNFQNLAENFELWQFLANIPWASIQIRRN